VELGQVLSVHRGTVGAGGLWWYYVGIGVFVTGGSVAAREILTAIVLLGLTGLIALLPLSRWRQTLTIHERGLVWRGLLRERVVPGEQILGAKVDWHSGEMSSWSELVVILPHSRQLRLRGVADVEGAAATLARFVALPVAPPDAPSVSEAPIYGRRA
jgi:hypothetical protein